jgi:hypothetical protein
MWCIQLHFEGQVSLNSVLGLASGLRTGRFGVRIPFDKKRVFSLPKRTDLIWKSTSLLFDGYLSYFLVVKRRSVRNTRLQLVQNLKMSGDISLLLCISLGFGQGRIHLPLFLNNRLGKKLPKLGGWLILRIFSNRLCNLVLKKRR